MPSGGQRYRSFTLRRSDASIVERLDEAGEGRCLVGDGLGGRGLRALEGRVGRTSHSDGTVPIGAFVGVERDGLAAAAAGWHVWAAALDPRVGPSGGWRTWHPRAEEAADLLDELGVVWLAEDGRAPAWAPERLELLAAPLRLRTPWSGLASALMWGMFVALVCFIVWFQEVPVVPIITVVVAVWLLVSVRRITSTLTVDHDGVEVRNTFSRRQLAWEDIEGVGTATPFSIWTSTGTMALNAVAFRVRGRRLLVKAAGTATLSDHRLDAALAAVRPWCLTSGTPAERVIGDPDGPLWTRSTANASGP